MKTSLVILASVLLVLGMVSVAFGADTDTVTASVTVPGVLAIDADATIPFANTQPGGFDTKNLGFTVTSNTAYKVTTKANAATFTGGPTPFTISNLVFGASNTPYTELEQDILTGGTAPGTTHSVSHKLSIPAGTQSGTYSVGITLKVTTP